jgi:hypothetical protein
MTPTEQQLTCIAAAVQYAVLKIEAGAGSGKTSTLKLVAEAVPEPSLYVAFNKVTATEAAEKFPAHVTCKTTHSIAYSKFGRSLQDKLTRPKGGYVNVAFTGTEIARYYKVGAIMDMELGTLATTENAVGLFVRQTVERFEQSADAEINEFHLPRFDMQKTLQADPSAAAYVLRLAKKLWQDRIDPKSPVLASHDTYLKLFQLSKPNLGFKVVYLDEAQDSTPCVLDIVMSQANHGAKIVLVGDRRQAIYGWRGAINAMQRVEGHSTILSKSFRFGQGVADVATAVLQGTMKLTGREDMPSVIGRGVVDRTKPYMYLFRTNSGLLYSAVAAISKGENIRLEIDVKDFLRLLESAWALSKNDMRNVKHENILPYPTWREYKEEAEKMAGEMKRIVSIIDGGDYFRFVRTLEGFSNPTNAPIVYTTAHKAKGREHDQVLLADDFPSHYDGGEWVGLNEMEQNLLYVAVTRAMRVLETNDSVQEALDYYHNKEADPLEAEHAAYAGRYEDFDHEEDIARLEHYQLNGNAPMLMPSLGAVGKLNGEMAVEALHRGMEEDEWRRTRRDEGYSEVEIDNLPF